MKFTDTKVAASPTAKVCAVSSTGDKGYVLINDINETMAPVVNLTMTETFSGSNNYELIWNPSDQGRYGIVTVVSTADSNYFEVDQLPIGVTQLLVLQDTNGLSELVHDSYFYGVGPVDMYSQTLLTFTKFNTDDLVCTSVNINRDVVPLVRQEERYQLSDYYDEVADSYVWDTRRSRSAWISNSGNFTIDIPNSVIGEWSLVVNPDAFGTPGTVTLPGFVKKKGTFIPAQVNVISFICIEGGTPDDSPTIYAEIKNGFA